MSLLIKIMMLLLFIQTIAFAKIDIGEQTYEGVVSKITTKSITVMNKGKLWEIPRSKVSTKKNIKIGSKVMFVLSEKELRNTKITNPPKVKLKK